MAEGSGFDQGVYIWRVAMPLFVPSDVVTLSWSERIGGGARKFHKNDEDALNAAISSAIGDLGVEEDALGEFVSRGTSINGNRRVDEVVGYTHLLLGDVSSAQESLARAEVGTAAIAWEQEIIDRVRNIIRILNESGPDRAVAQLDRWCEQTVGALGLRR
jgi:hypothetical protein